METTYRIIPDYFDNFGSDANEESVLTEDDIERIAYGFEKTVEEVKEMLYENTEDNVEWYLGTYLEMINRHSRF